MGFENIELAIDRDEAVAVITINRPKALNALNSLTLDELSAAIDACAEANVRAAIITGAGKAFVAGADISQMIDFSPEDAYRLARKGHDLGEKMEAQPFPIIAAVNGFALGGGCELAMACDFIIASKRAKFGQPEVNLGVIPGFGGTQRLARYVGTQRARELVYSGRIISADEAYHLGLAARVVEPEALMTVVTDVAKNIASKGPLAIKAAKEVVIKGADMSLKAANEHEARTFGALFESSDQSEGMNAFLEKRKAVFKGE